MRRSFFGPGFGGWPGMGMASRPPRGFGGRRGVELPVSETMAFTAARMRRVRWRPGATETPLLEPEEAPASKRVRGAGRAVERPGSEE